MKIKRISLRTYAILLTNGLMRSGILIHLINDQGCEGWGDAAPLPKWSAETAQDAYKQLTEIKKQATEIEWNLQNLSEQINMLQLYPSVSFGLESAILSLLDPLPSHSVGASALLMGSPEEIFTQANLRQSEGFKSAKLKVSQLTFEEAFEVIHQLKDLFRLRIDVNKAWATFDSLKFFEQFPIDTFDYVEEPFQNPEHLEMFPHPLAVDESFPKNLSLNELERLPTLKALIYKPTIQGGITYLLPLKNWAEKSGIEIVLSSSFESDLGLYNIASIGHRLSLSSPVGLGTYHYLQNHVCASPMQFSDSLLQIPESLTIL